MGVRKKKKCVNGLVAFCLPACSLWPLDASADRDRGNDLNTVAYSSLINATMKRDANVINMAIIK